MEQLLDENKIGFKDDEIFLLSVDEYKQYKENIPRMNSWWWLRSPGSFGIDAAIVDYDGSVHYYGYVVDIDLACVRPALKYSNLKSEISESKKENCFIWNEIRWTIIDKEKEIAIAEMPIAFMMFDNDSNDYETSEIREFLKKWKDERI